MKNTTSLQLWILVNSPSLLRVVLGEISVHLSWVTLPLIIYLWMIFGKLMEMVPLPSFVMMFGSAPFLKIRFPRLFSITSSPLASVASYGFWDGCRWVWSFSWCRDLHPRDLIEKSLLDNLLQQVSLSMVSKDSMIWVHHKLENFSSKSLNLELDKVSLSPDDCAIKGIWKRWSPNALKSSCGLRSLVK